MMRARIYKKSLGFTLIELLVVVMMVGILASLAIARYVHARERGYIAAASYDVDLVRKMLAYYAVDWNTYPASASSYQELQDCMVDLDGQPLGQMPSTSTFDFVSYELDANTDYILRVRARDNAGTVLVATPETVVKEGP